MNEQNGSKKAQAAAGAAAAELKLLQETVERLQSQFASTGTVQAADMARVLGDPVRGIEVDLGRSFSSSTWKTI